MISLEPLIWISLEPLICRSAEKIDVGHQRRADLVSRYSLPHDLTESTHPPHSEGQVVPVVDASLGFQLEDVVELRYTGLVHGLRSSFRSYEIE